MTDTELLYYFLVMDLGLVTAVVIALFTVYTKVAWSYRRWYLKSSFPVISGLSLIFGFLVGYRYSALKIWKQIKSLEPGYFSQIDEIINPYLPSFIPSFNWIFLFGFAIIYMILLHYIIPIIWRSRNK